MQLDQVLAPFSRLQRPSERRRHQEPNGGTRIRRRQGRRPEDRVGGLLCPGKAGRSLFVTGHSVPASHLVQAVGRQRPRGEPARLVDVARDVEGGGRRGRRGVGGVTGSQRRRPKVGVE